MALRSKRPHASQLLAILERGLNLQPWATRFTSQHFVQASEVIAGGNPCLRSFHGCGGSPRPGMVALALGGDVVSGGARRLLHGRRLGLDGRAVATTVARFARGTANTALSGAAKAVVAPISGRCAVEHREPLVESFRGYARCYWELSKARLRYVSCSQSSEPDFPDSGTLFMFISRI